MVVSCPICHNDIKFESKGKSDKEIINLFDVNQELLDRIYEDKNLKDFVEKEGAEFHLVKA